MENSVKPGLRLIDRLLLVLAWLISCSAVYGLGFYTGSQLQERVSDDEERIVRLPVTADPPNAGQHAKAGDDFTFYDTLVPGSSRPRPGDAVTAERPGPEPPAPGKSEPARNHAAAATKAPAKVAAKAPPSKVPAQTRAARPGGGATRSTGHSASGTKMTARASTPASDGTGAARSKLHAANPESKPTPSKSRHPSATRTAAAAPSKRPTSGSGAAGGSARSAAVRTEERPAARASHPRDGVARSAVASE